MLDLWSQNADQSALDIARTSADKLPAGFGESFSAAWDEGRLFSDSVAHGNAQMAAFGDYLDEAKQAFGKDISKEVYSRTDLIPAANDAVAKLKAENLEVNFPDLTPDELDRRAIAKSRAAQTRYAETQARDHSGLGSWLGSAAAAAIDPLNLAAAPVAPAEGLGVLATAIRFGGVAAASQAGVETLGASYHEQVQPGYLASGAPVANVLEAGAGGMVLGVATKALGAAWSRVKSGVWPTSVRDIGNVVESEAQIANTNVLPGAEGEHAHREALAGAIDQILSGQSVDIETQLAGRALSARLEREAPFTLPVMDERAIRLTSEEAGLKARHVELDEHLAGLPAGDQAAADTLARLSEIDRQIGEATTAAERRPLQQRRDELLTDTSPEKLQAAAAPIEQRRAATAEQASISGRLSDIAGERARLAPTTPPANMGQRQFVPRTLYDLHEGRIDRLVNARSAPNGADAISEGITSIAKTAGYDMPKDEAAAIANRVSKSATDDEARGILGQVADRPRTLADTMPSVSDAARAAREEAARSEQPQTRTPKAMRETLGSAEHVKALREDIDRARMIKDVQVPVDTDANGEPIFRSLDSMMNEVDTDLEAADHLEACTNQSAAEAA
jgi:hypothetical protein